MVPVSVRDQSEKMALGNRVAGIFMELPVGRMPARRRLQQVSRAMGDLKEKRQAVAADTMLAMTSWAPATLHSLAGQLGYTNQRFINLVVSNVPGIQVPVYAGGAKLLEAYPLLPVAVNLGVVVCVTSYNGGMYFGIVGDYDSFADLHVLAEGIQGGVENLERAAGMRAPKRVARPAPNASTKARAGEANARPNRRVAGAAKSRAHAPVTAAKPVRRAARPHTNGKSTKASIRDAAELAARTN
jgi:hypothetical protein